MEDIYSMSVILRRIFDEKDLALHRHRTRQYRRLGPFPPRSRDGLCFREELQPLFAVEMQVTQEAAPRPRETEHGQGNGNRNVDSNMSHIDFVDELPRVAPVRREYCRSVSIRVGVDEFDGIFEGVHVYDAQNGPEEFFGVADV